jgi:hypothetical protein
MVLPDVRGNAVMVVSILCSRQSPPGRVVGDNLAMRADFGALDGLGPDLRVQHS